ncbi:MAG: PhzF family phenazine biosynthesis protein [Vulcanimicrobiaceae bacterium]
MPDYRYLVVDVFTQTQLAGNALAVFPDSRGLDAAAMQKIAKELNLAETAFVFPPRSDAFAAQLRIFTPTMEMLFAGHPTVGTSYVLLQEGIVPAGTQHFVLEENIGPVPVRVEPGAHPMIWLTTPPIEFGRTYDRALCASAVQVEESDLCDHVQPQTLSAGNPNVYIPLRTKEAVDRAWCDRAGATQLLGSAADPTCIFVFTPTAQGAYARMFAPEHGVVEDPATGSATGPLAAYMMRHGLAPHADGTRFLSEQGTKMGRRSLLHVLIHGEFGSRGIEVGGHVTPLVEATMSFRDL